MCSFFRKLQLDKYGINYLNFDAVCIKMLLFLPLIQLNLCSPFTIHTQLLLKSNVDLHSKQHVHNVRGFHCPIIKWVRGQLLSGLNAYTCTQINTTVQHSHYVQFWSTKCAYLLLLFDNNGVQRRLFPSSYIYLNYRQQKCDYLMKTNYILQLLSSSLFYRYNFISAICLLFIY